MRRLLRVVLAAGAGAVVVLGYVVATTPDVRPLRTADPERTAFMALRDAEARAAGRPVRREQRWVPYRRISPHLTRAVLVSEDAAFWTHDGLDLDEIKVSLETNLRQGRFVRGASTITQQLAKNLYLSPSKDPLRKLRELVITRRLEAELPKRRIYELYLNVVEWGDGIYGAEAAARRHFGTSAAALGPREAALLAGALVNPRVLIASRPDARLLRRQRTILARMGAPRPPRAAPSPQPDATPALDRAAQPE